MEKQTAVVPDAGEVVRIYLALELSRSSWLVASHTPAADKISRHKLAAGDIDGLLALIERLRTRVGQKTGHRSSPATRPATRPATMGSGWIGN